MTISEAKGTSCLLHSWWIIKNYLWEVVSCSGNVIALPFIIIACILCMYAICRVICWKWKYLPDLALFPELHVQVLWKVHIKTNKRRKLISMSFNCVYDKFIKKMYLSSTCHQLTSVQCILAVVIITQEYATPNWKLQLTNCGKYYYLGHLNSSTSS